MLVLLLLWIETILLGLPSALLIVLLLIVVIIVISLRMVAHLASRCLVVTAS